MGSVTSLGDAALKGELGRALGEARSGYERGWVLAAMGRYGEALEVLSTVDGAPALVTRASVLRQVGLHDRAELLDRQALALAANDAGALIGLVADGVGLGVAPEELTARLDRAAESAPAAGWRQGVRLAWVHGEVAMVRGDVAAARRWFADARDQAQRRSADRHTLKSRAFLAAVALVGGDAARARDRALRVAGEAAEMGALGLHWPALLVAADAAAALGEQEIAAALRARATHALRSLLDSLPPDLAAEARRRAPLPV